MSSPYDFFLTKPSLTEDEVLHLLSQDGPLVPCLVIDPLSDATYYCPIRLAENPPSHGGLREFKATLPDLHRLSGCMLSGIFFHSLPRAGSIVLFVALSEHGDELSIAPEALEEMREMLQESPYKDAIASLLGEYPATPLFCMLVAADEPLCIEQVNWQLYELVERIGEAKAIITMM